MRKVCSDPGHGVAFVAMLTAVRPVFGACSEDSLGCLRSLNNLFGEEQYEDLRCIEWVDKHTHKPSPFYLSRLFNERRGCRSKRRRDRRLGRRTCAFSLVHSVAAGRIAHLLSHSYRNKSRWRPQAHAHPRPELHPSCPTATSPGSTPRSRCIRPTQRSPPSTSHLPSSVQVDRCESNVGLYRHHPA